MGEGHEVCKDGASNPHGELQGSAGARGAPALRRVDILPERQPTAREDREGKQGQEQEAREERAQQREESKRKPYLALGRSDYLHLGGGRRKGLDLVL